MFNPNEPGNKFKAIKEPFTGFEKEDFVTDEAPDGTIPALALAIRDRVEGQPICMTGN